MEGYLPPVACGTGIVLATLSAIFWLLTLPVLPIFSMTILFIDALIIYGLARVSEAS